MVDDDLYYWPNLAIIFFHLVLVHISVEDARVVSSKIGAQYLIIAISVSGK